MCAQFLWLWQWTWVVELSDMCSKIKGTGPKNLPNYLSNFTPVHIKPQSFIVIITAGISLCAKYKWPINKSCDISWLVINKWHKTLLNIQLNLVFKFINPSFSVILKNNCKSKHRFRPFKRNEKWYTLYLVSKLRSQVLSELGIEAANGFRFM